MISVQVYLFVVAFQSGENVALKNTIAYFLTNFKKVLILFLKSCYFTNQKRSFLLKLLSVLHNLSSRFSFVYILLLPPSEERFIFFYNALRGFPLHFFHFHLFNTVEGIFVILIQTMPDKINVQSMKSLHPYTTVLILQDPCISFLAVPFVLQEDSLRSQYGISSISFNCPGYILPVIIRLSLFYVCLSIITFFQIIMSTQGELKHRQSKRKIFIDDPIKLRPQQLPTKKIPLQPHHSHNQQSRKQIQQLQQSVRQLKNLLTEEREKYDQLFEEYEQLIEKNNLIEKQYINLKYQHNKEVKNIKKTCKEKVEEEVRKCIEEFNGRMNGENVTEGVRLKIEKLIANLEQVSQSFLMKSKKYHNHDSHLKTSDLLQKLNRKEDTVITHTQKIDIYEIQEKIEYSPTKQPVKQLPQTNKQVIFEDQYYGDLDDYEHLQQKLTQRRNYELMKNVNRNSSEFRRKKIFNKPSPFQCPP